jgi:hypothetical protein
LTYGTEIACQLWLTFNIQILGYFIQNLLHSRLKAITFGLIQRTFKYHADKKLERFQAVFNFIGRHRSRAKISMQIWLSVKNILVLSILCACCPWDNKNELYITIFGVQRTHYVKIKH